jgi:hypothetical protein
MGYGRFNDNEDFMRGVKLSYSPRFKTIEGFLSHAMKHYLDELEGKVDYERYVDIVLGCAAELFLQDPFAARVLLQESGLYDLARKDKKIEKRIYDVSKIVIRKKKQSDGENLIVIERPGPDDVST